MFFHETCQDMVSPTSPLSHYIASLLYNDIVISLHCYIVTLLHCYIATLLYCYIANPKPDTVALPWEELAGAYRSEHSAYPSKIIQKWCF